MFKINTILVILLISLLIGCKVSKRNSETSLREIDDITTEISDSIFKEYVQFMTLSAWSIYDENKDFKLSSKEALNIKEIKIDAYSEIKSLSGIEFFSNIEKLTCSQTGLVELNLNNNPNIRYLDCSNTRIEKLDLNNNFELEELYCFQTPIGDFAIDKCVNLEILECYRTQIAILDTRRLYKLKKLSCSNTRITALDISHNKKLVEFNFSNTDITNIDLSNNTELEYLYCFDTKIDNLNLKNNTKLKSISSWNVALKEIDIRNNADIESISLWKTLVEELDLSHNRKLQFIELLDTPLKTIQVWDTFNVDSLKRFELPKTTQIITSQSNIAYDPFTKEDAQPIVEQENIWHIGAIDVSKVTAYLQNDTLVIEGEGKMKSHLAEKWYKYNKDIKHIEIRDGVKNIADNAFEGCINLISISLSKDLESIGKYAFSKCYNLQSIVIPNKVETIKRYTFYECHNLKYISIGDNVKNIEEYAFRDCNAITTIQIPEQTENIDILAFTSCSSLKSIEVHPNNLHYCDMDGVLYNKSGNKILSCPPLKEGVFKIPLQVRSIEKSAFANCVNLTSILLPENIEDIGELAFSGCHKIETIAIPNKVKELRKMTFSHCDKLKNIKIGSGLISISDYAFSGSEGLINIDVDEANPQYKSQEGILYSKNLTSLIQYPKGRKDPIFIIHDGITNIGSQAFSDNKYLKSITISPSIVYIGHRAFSGCHELRYIFNQNTTPQKTEEDSFLYLRKDIELFVPKGSVSSYQNDELWGKIKLIKAMQ